MAKLKDQMTSQELLELILSGTIKNEIIKKYRSSDEELAMMLLPLYRNGDLSKEEFNDFFKGVTLSPRESETAEPTREPSQEDLPPSEIVRSLAPEEHELPPEVEEPVEHAEPAESAAPEEALDLDLTPPSEEAEILEPVPPDTSAYVNGEAPEEKTEISPSGPGEEQFRSDSAAVSSILDMIFAKLGSIDSRLAVIEKKLSSQ